MIVWLIQAVSAINLLLLKNIKQNFMTKVQLAIDLFSGAYSCSQAILIAFSDDIGIDEDLAFRIGAGLGGGVGRTQSICGAISAGAIVLGMKYATYLPDDIESKNRLSSFVGEFVNECKQAIGAVDCLHITGVDFTNTELKAFATESGHFKRVCNNAIMHVASILERYLKTKSF
jgi:C_GCAxxG_C_C family probable redox protein